MSNPFAIFIAGFTPGLYGLMISAPLYGIGLAQTTYFYRTFPNERLHWKIFVALLLILDTAHMCGLSEAVLYAFMVQGLAPVYPWGMKLASLVTFVTAFVVQCAYTIRVYYVSNKHRLLTGAVFLFAVVQFVAGMGTGYEMAVGTSLLSSQTRKTKTYGGIHLIASVGCDILISIALVYNLNKSRSGIRKTANIIDRLIIHSISVGIITSIVAIITLALWFALPDDFRFAILHFVVSKVYINSFLATLNSRSSLRDNDTVVSSLSSLKFQGARQIQSTSNNSNVIDKER